jgi:hypothetical protein
MPPFGLSFLPFQQAGEQRDRASVEPIQQAIKVLTLRLPRVLGGGAPAPASLLQGGGSMGNPFAGVGPMQGRPITAPLPSPSPAAPSPSAGPSPYGGGAGNPFARQAADPMSQAIMALVGGAGGGFGAPPPPIARPTPEQPRAWEPPPYRWQPPQDLPPPPPLPGPNFGFNQTAPPDETQPEPAPDLPRELADWLYRSERGEMRRV